MDYYSQIDQDRYFNEEIFKNKRNGIFLDIGAHDGIQYSNSYYFEKNLGWTGICIEPMKEIFKKLIENRKCICVNKAISSNYGEENFITVKNATMLSGLERNCHNDHFKRIENEGMIKEKIQTFTLDSILDEYSLGQIDFCSLDTEGSELDILKSLNFEKHIIKYFTIENSYNMEEIHNFILSKGYEKIIQKQWDGIYKRI